MEPTFLIVGAQRCGTTSTWAYLRQHPGVCVANEKELNYFQPNGAGRRSAEGTSREHLMLWYEKQFDHCLDLTPPYPVGEASPNYMYYPTAISNIHQVLPDVQLVVILRHPVDRALSHYRWEVRMQNEKLPVLRAFQEERTRLLDGSRHNYEHFGYVERGQYARQLRYIYHLFPPEQVFVCQFFDLVHYTQAFMDLIVLFIGAHLWNGDFSTKWLETEEEPIPEGTEDYLFEKLGDEIVQLREEFGIVLERA